ncbi:hypothetical protein ACIBCT_05565 [Streptosporangium sp. NPDC050855]|uniref:hypothetical protein n=1 Tax=Streptosporangium sp. NPDC050855 TaxID=3366194 RepID=UPI0037AF8DDD
MAQTTAALLVLASLLSGGTAAGGTPQASPERVRVSAQAAAPNLRACYDGRCRLTLSKTARFRVSPRFGVTRLSISFTSRLVRVKATGPGVTSQAVFGTGGSGTVNGISVRVVSLSKGKAVLRLTPVR